LTSVAISIAFNGMIGLIINIDFLAFLVNIYRFLNDLVVFVELGFIVFLLFMSTHKTNQKLLKIAIIVYVVLKLLIALNIF
jgi:hypothetical protein